MATRRRVEFELVGHAGNIEAVLNQLNRGITQTQRGARTTNRELGMMDRNLMAIGTTARYAFAGGIVFGITGAIRRLTDFQNRLGEVAGLAGRLNAQTGVYQGPSNQFLERVGDEAILASNRVGVATEDIQSYMTRFFSAFDVNAMGGDQKLAQLRGFVDQVAGLQALLGPEAGDPQQLAGGIAGLVRQIDPQQRNIAGTTARVSNLISLLLAQTPNITGRDISRDIGRVGATMNIANMTPEQAFAVWAVAGRAGGSASVIGRGVSQLLGSSLLHPNTPAQRQAFAQVGLPTDPTALRNMGGFQVLQRMLHAVAPHGARINRTTANMLNSEDVTDEDAVGALAGRNTGVNLTLLYQLLGRQESVRQFVNLIGQDGVTALRRYIQLQNRATDSGAAAERIHAAVERRILQRAATAASNIPLQLIRQVRWPLEHAVAPAAIRTSDEMARHPRATQVVEATLGAALGIYGARRLLSRFRGGGITGATGAAAGAAITAEQLSNLVGGGQADGSRDNPYWVMISPASWSIGQPGGDPLRRPTGDPLPIPRRGAAGRLLSRLAPWAVMGSLYGGAIAATAVGAFDAAALLETPGATRQRPQGRGRFAVNMNDDRSFADLGRPDLARPFLAALEARHMRASDVQRVEFNGKADADLTIRLTDAQGRTITVQEHKGVPFRFVPQEGVPTQQGRAGKRRGGR